jgi:DNA-binding NtrC family response regulator
LRKRLADVPALARQFLADLTRGSGRRIAGFTRGALQKLMEHDWPGNVRELRNAIEAAMVVCRSDLIGEDDLPLLRSTFLRMPLDKEASSVLEPLPPGPEIDRLMEALKVTNWNVTKTARMLRWSRMTVYRKVAKYGVERPTDGYEPSEDILATDKKEERTARSTGCS